MMNVSPCRLLTRSACACTLLLLAALTGLVACSDSNEPSGSDQQLVYVEASYSGVSRVVRVDADGSHRTVLYGDTEIFGVYPAPDGRILIRARAGWFLVPAGGRTAAPFTAPDHPDLGIPYWSPDGESIAWSVYTGTTYGIGVAAAGGATLQVITPDSLQTIWPSWSPDGARVAFSAQGFTGGGRSSVFVVNRDGSGLHQVTGDSLYVVDPPSWSRSGNQIAFIRFDIWTVAPDGTNPRQVTTGGAAGDFDGFEGWLYWSDNDMDLMATSRRFHQVYRVNAVSGAQSDLNVPSPGGDPLSPDATRILTTGRTRPDSLGNTGPAVLVAFADGSNATQITPDSVASWGAVWLPDVN